MQPGPIAMLAVSAFALFVSWNYWHGTSRGVPLYYVWMAIVGSLALAGLADAGGRAGLAEVLNVAAIGLALAGLAASPRLWRDEIQAREVQARLYRALGFRDFLSWQGSLKLVARMGAVPVALTSLSMFACALAVSFLAGRQARPETEVTFAVLPLVAPGLFGLLSTAWIYRGLAASVRANETPDTETT